MDHDARQAARILTCLADTGERLTGLARLLRNTPHVKSVTKACEVRHLASGPVVAFYVDAELDSGNAVSWGLETSWDEGGWSIETGVRLTESSGQAPLIELGDRRVQTLDELVAEISAGTSGLVSSLTRLDLSGL
jgi:hypothetical protein